jgi:hypothetical protein
MMFTESITVADWIGDRTNCTRVELGGTLVITCTALGNPIPSILWWKDNLPVEEQAALRHDIQIRVENCSTISTLKVFEMWYVNFVDTEFFYFM